MLRKEVIAYRNEGGKMTLGVKCMKNKGGVKVKENG